METRSAGQHNVDRQATVLIVDDDPTILESVGDVVRIAGYKLIMAPNGIKALQAMRYHKPDLIVADIMMPEMDGYQFYETVRENPDWTVIPFIFLTAKGEQKDIRAGYRLGADHYLTKPIEPEDLLIAIEARLNRTAEIQTATREEIEHTKAWLLSIFGHELRESLNWVYGHVTMLEEGHRIMSADVIERMLHSTRSGTERLLRLIEDLMLLVHIDSGLTQLEIEQYREHLVLQRHIGNAIQALIPQAKEKNITFSYPLDNNLVVLGVPAYIEEILKRLIDNAIKFGKENGHIWVQTEEQGGFGLISVQDNGIGITPEQQHHLFERLEQIDRTGTDRQNLGLGLTIAYRLAQLHGGDIKVEGQPGEGSTFTVLLPLLPGAH
jgi:two-component system sensor histidine kinase/response regulator